MMAHFTDEIECEICLDELSNDQPYAKIDNKSESGKYHVECLERWLRRCNNGLHTQDRIMSYSIYHCNQIIETVKVTDNPFNGLYYIDNIQEPIIVRTNRGPQRNQRRRNGKSCISCTLI